MKPLAIHADRPCVWISSPQPYHPRQAITTLDWIQHPRTPLHLPPVVFNDDIITDLLNSINWGRI